MTDAFRCAASSSTRDEPMFATASTVANWLLLEHPGPWGFDALRHGRLPEGVGERLARAAAAANVRILLIRRPTRGPAAPTSAFAIHSGPEEPWIERIELARLEDVATIDLDRLGAGERLGRGEPHPDPIFIVCTHGRHDPCCAELGRPLARAIGSVFPGQTWESSHLGGDRFAANVVAFPHGVYFGRVAPADGPQVARSYIGGRLDLRHLRGRSCRPTAVQAAEHVLRLREALDGVDDVDLERAVRSGSELVATFRTVAGRFEVRVAREAAPEAVRLTCHSSSDESPPVYRTLAIERVA